MSDRVVEKLETAQLWPMKSRRIQSVCTSAAALYSNHCMHTHGSGCSPSISSWHSTARLRVIFRDVIGHNCSKPPLNMLTFPFFLRECVRVYMRVLNA